ncbi:glycoside hydrolase family 140 protein [Mycolicibacterium sp. jd]|uniref:glycoside hydrolase family 140 protein n=1 Tax=unclassified Mycolicibacterium TaxID=2636767 RepID=UPI00351B0A31
MTRNVSPAPEKPPRRQTGGWFTAIAVAIPTLIFVGLGLQSGVSAKTDGPVPTPPLLVSDNSRYFLDAAGEPFFWMADTAWSLPINLTRDEVVTYLDTRNAQGFNVIQTVAIFNQAGGPGPNRYGDWPYDKTLSQLAIADGADPNDPGQYDYWDHLDFIVDQANIRGIRLALVPVWAHGQIGDLVTHDNAEEYGRFIGARYRDRKIIWVLGGDAAANGHEDVWRALARGIAQGLTGRENYQGSAMTYHPIGGTSATRWFRGDPWLTFDMMQGGHCLRYNERRDLLRAAYETAPTRPFLDGEPIYSGHPYCWDQEPEGYSTPIDVRRDAYWAVFAGAAGHTYGDHAVWQFSGSTGRSSELGAVGEWRSAMEDEAAWQMRNLVSLVHSYPWWKGTPDNGRIVKSVRSGGARLQAMSAADRSYALIYSPDGEEFEADIATVVDPRAQLSWFDPRSGERTPLGALEAGKVSYTPPSDEDWVLVADANP